MWADFFSLFKYTKCIFHLNLNIIFKNIFMRGFKRNSEEEQKQNIILWPNICKVNYLFYTHQLYFFCIILYKCTILWGGCDSYDPRSHRRLRNTALIITGYNIISLNFGFRSVNIWCHCCLWCWCCRSQSRWFSWRSQSCWFFRRCGCYIYEIKMNQV